MYNNSWKTRKAMGRLVERIPQCRIVIVVPGVTAILYRNHDPEFCQSTVEAYRVFLQSDIDKLAVIWAQSEDDNSEGYINGSSFIKNVQVLPIEHDESIANNSKLSGL